MSWIIFAILGPALYSITNFIDKYLMEKRIKNPLVMTICMGFASLTIGIILVLSQGLYRLPFVQLLFILISGIFLNFYLVPYFKALRLDDASRVIPLYSFIPVFTLILSYLFLGEGLTNREFLGFFTILIGGFILSAEKIDEKIFTPRKSLYFMIIASFMYSISIILFKFVVIRGNFIAIFGYQAIGIGIGAISMLLYSPLRLDFFQNIKKFKSNVWSLIAANEIISKFAQLSLSYALVLAPAALVSVIGESQPFFVLLFGIILSLYFPHIIQEDIQKSTIGIKLFCIILIFVGIYLIYI